MTIDIVRGTSTKPVSSNELTQLMSSQLNWIGQMFIGYPIIATIEGPYRIDALLISAEKGIVVFDLIEGNDAGNYELRQDDAANKLEAKLKPYRDLMDRRELRIPVHPISFAPGMQGQDECVDGDYPIVTCKASLIQAFDRFKWENKKEGIYAATLSAIENISTIRKSGMSRIVRQENSRGARLKKLEASIATLDNIQSRAVIETVDGVQRIRGLAGSGKTIVLALKAAYLHAQHPEWRISVTFNTRSLKGQFQRLINNFYLGHTGEEPNWEYLRIVNAWGASGGGGRDGIYYEFCLSHDIAYFDFGMAKKRFGQGNEFSGACDYALGQVRQSKHLYDAILVDEAQDFSPAFLRICYALLSDHKRLVYAYDELQNLSEVPLPSPDQIFPINAQNPSQAQFEDAGGNTPQNDIILTKCYRNSRPILSTAHSLGFGVYREPQEPGDSGLIQMFDYPDLWEEVGYRLEQGELQEGSSVTLSRSDESSPAFLEEHSDIDDLVLFKHFDDELDQTEWLVEAIRNNLENDELRHNDIIVINPDPISTRHNAGPIRLRLLEMGINSHIAGIDTDPDIFFQKDDASVTFTGIYRAKGNEAGMVYIINAQDCHSAARNLASIRNRLFTAITRSKAWIRVLGVGNDMKALEEEFEKLKERDFKLTFTYPTKAQREELRIVHRDLTKKDQQRLQNREQNLRNLLKDLESGVVHIEDLNKEVLNKLRDRLDN